MRVVSWTIKKKECRISEMRISPEILIEQIISILELYLTEFRSLACSDLSLHQKIYYCSFFTFTLVFYYI